MCIVVIKNKGCFKRIRVFLDGELFDKYFINVNNNEILYSLCQLIFDSGILEEYSKGDLKGFQILNN